MGCRVLEVMHFVRKLVAFAVFLLGLTNAEAQTVEDCAAIENKEIRQECFNAAFANKADPSSEVTEQNPLFSEEQAEDDKAALLEILDNSGDTYWSQFAEAYSTCWFGLGSIRVNVFRREMYQSSYELKLGELSSAELHSQMKPNDTVKVTTKRSHPVSLDSKVYTQDGQTLISDRSGPVRTIFLNPKDKADIPELLQIVQRGIERCSAVEQSNSAQTEPNKREDAAAASPLLGYFQVEASVGELGAYEGGRKCLDWAYLEEFRSDGLSGVGPGGNTAECVFADPVPQGAIVHVTNLDCKINNSSGKFETSYTMHFEWTQNRLVTVNPEIPGNRLVHVKCEKETKQ